MCTCVDTFAQGWRPLLTASLCVASHYIELRCIALRGIALLSRLALASCVACAASAGVCTSSAPVWRRRGRSVEPTPTRPSRCTGRAPSTAPRRRRAAAKARRKPYGRTPARGDQPERKHGWQHKVMSTSSQRSLSVCCICACSVWESPFPMSSGSKSNMHAHDISAIHLLAQVHAWFSCRSVTARSLG